MATAQHPHGEAGRSLSLAEFWDRIDPQDEQPAANDRGRARVPAPAGVTTLVVPGLHGSGDDHWQSLWCIEEEDCRQVDLGDWDEPSRELWVARLDRAVARERRPVVLAAHSLGCHAVALWAAEASAPRLRKVVGALLVAPPDVDRPDAHPLIRGFAPVPLLPLPFAALLIASRDDRYARFERLAELADRWGAGLVDAGPLGHINAESEIGDWPEGRALLRALREPWLLDAADLEAVTGYALRERPGGARSIGAGRLTQGEIR